MEETVKIEVKDKVKVTNQTRGAVSYYSQSFVKRRVWEKPKTYLFIPIEEIEDIMQTIGGLSLFQDGLYISNPTVRKYLGIDATDESELTDGKIKKMFHASTSLEEFDRFLKALTVSLRSRIAQEAISSELVSYDKADIILEHTGVDVVQAISMKREMIKEQKAAAALNNKK